MLIKIATFFLGIFFLLIQNFSYAFHFLKNNTLNKVLNKQGKNLTFVMMSEDENTITVFNLKRALKEFSPASTFKVSHTIIGLSLGSVKSVDEIIFHYHGEELPLKEWEHDMSLKDAIKVSNVRAYQVLSRKIGLKRMLKNIKKLKYGNQTIGNKVDEFWLDGTLKISALGEAQFFIKLAKEKLPYDKAILRKVKDIIILKSHGNYKLYGKTGLYVKGNQRVAWIAGFVQKKGHYYSFAFNQDVSKSKDLSLRQKIAEESLQSLGI
jgi:beta-lactamase class D